MCESLTPQAEPDGGRYCDAPQGVETNGTLAMRIVPGDLDDPRVVDLLQTHLATARAATAEGSAHALDLRGLRAPDIRLWTIWTGDVLAGTGALKVRPGQQGEVKSMHTARDQRGRGVGSAMLRHIIAAARAEDLTRLSLETGSWAYFEPAVALYRRHGFEPCEPFADYRADPNSLFLSLALNPSAPSL